MRGSSPWLPGWGVEVRFPGRREWHLIVRPGTETPLCTHLDGARGWAGHYERRGCKVRLVELDMPRGPSFRKTTEAPAPALTLELF